MMPSALWHSASVCIIEERKTFFFTFSAWLAWADGPTLKSMSRAVRILRTTSHTVRGWVGGWVSCSRSTALAVAASLFSCCLSQFTVTAPGFAEEWTRMLDWEDRDGKVFTCEECWSYVTGPAQAGELDTAVPRDINNDGKLPQDFLEVCVWTCSSV